jgi:tetratricopeptide (TPR) repeat protein
MEPQNLDAKIEAAWQAHRQGQNDAAVEEFQHILAEAPDHIDAYWGLGLSYRDLGNQSGAVDAFNKVKELIATRLAEESVQPGRYFMLNRMADQQIEQLRAAS